MAKLSELKKLIDPNPVAVSNIQLEVKVRLDLNYKLIYKANIITRNIICYLNTKEFIF